MRRSLQIERVDAIPILVTWLQPMAVAEHIGSHWTPHRAWAALWATGDALPDLATLHLRWSGTVAVVCA